MTAIKQTIGLTNFSGGDFFSKCPVNPDAIKSIVFTNPSNLSVVNGSATEIQLSLAKFFIPVNEASQMSFTIPGATCGLISIHELNLSGISITNDAKFIGLFPQYGTASNVDSLYLEWTQKSMIDSELLKNASVIQTTDLNFFQINEFEFSWGGSIPYTGIGATGSLFAVTNGGLLKWNGNVMKLWNTINSNCITNTMTALEIDANNTLWIGTDSGLLQFNENSNNFGIVFDDSKLPSNTITDVKLYSSEIGAIATDSGLAIFNPSDTVSGLENYTIYNSSLLKHKLITKVNIASSISLFAGTTGGVYMLNLYTKRFSNFPLNSSNVTGWTASNNVQSIESFNNVLYVGTDTGLVIIPSFDTLFEATNVPFGVTASTIVSGIASANFTSLKIKKHNSVNYLYAGHGDNGSVSVYNIDTGIWTYSLINPNLVNGPVTDVIPDFLSTSVDTTVYAGNNVDSGIQKILIYNEAVYDNGWVDSINDKVPSLNENVNILSCIPDGATSGNFGLDSNIYSIVQPMTFLFSKDMIGASSGSSIESFFKLSNSIGATVNGAWEWNSTGQIGTFTPTTPLERSSTYNVKIAMGCTSADGTYLIEGLDTDFYTENIEPSIGWNYMGKVLMLSGSSDKYTENIYIRNPHNTDINILALIGK